MERDAGRMSAGGDAGSSGGEYHYPGEHRYHGLTFHERITPETLDTIRLAKQQLDPKDVLLVSSPRAGTLMLQEMIYSIWHGLEAAEARTERIDTAFPCLEYSRIYNGKSSSPIAFKDPPRLVTTKLPAAMFDEIMRDLAHAPRVILLMRDPRDILVSTFHWYSDLKSLKFTRSWDEFFEMYQSGRLLWGDPLASMVGWWKKLESNPNSLVLYYEEVLQDRARTTRRVAEFLHKDLTENAVDKIAENTSIGAMRARGIDLYHPKQAYEKSFFRRGTPGDWKNYMTEEQAAIVGGRIKEKFGEAGIMYYMDGL